MRIILSTPTEETFGQRGHAHGGDIRTEQNTNVKKIPLETQRGHAHGRELHTERHIYGATYSRSNILWWGEM